MEIHELDILLDIHEYLFKNKERKEKKIHLGNNLLQCCFGGTWTAAPLEDQPEMKISQLQDVR